MLKMIGGVTARLKERSLGWKEDQLEMISWGLEEKVEYFGIVEGGKEYRIKEVDSLKAMGALITREADSMSAMKFQMNKADKAMWMDMKFLEKQGIC